MPQITLTLSDEEYQIYLTELARAQTLDYDPKILIIFNAPIDHTIPMTRAELPSRDEAGDQTLIDGCRSLVHRRFYNSALREVEKILRGEA